MATTLVAGVVEPTTTGDIATTHDPESTTTEIQLVETPATTDEPAPKKLSMIKAALQVLQDRKVAMTCPELIDVMSTEGLWTSPGGKTPAATLYAAISWSIKDLGKASPFKKSERGKFEAKIVVKG
ncbi:MAG: HTH domain-containing protein [Gemmatales bacterium]